MRKERKQIRAAEMSTNGGQLAWLPKNPRQWTEDDIDRTARSIVEDPDFLEDRPLLAVKNENGEHVIFAGNLRLTAAKKVGIDELPVVVYYPETDDDRDTVKRRAMKDNGSFGSWDWDELANNWSDFPLADFGIPAWPDDLGEGQPEDVTADEDNFDEEYEEIETVCKRGDIWKLGEHRLMCGDSLSSADVQKLCRGGQVTLLLTDPPYNVNVESSNGNKIMNDNMPEDEFRKFIENALQTADGVMAPGAVFYIWHGDSNGIVFRAAAEAVGWCVRQCLIWNKNHFVLGRQDYQWKHEPCLYGWKDGAAHYFFDSRSEATVIEDRPLDLKKMHKEELIKLIKETYSDKVATTVIDCDKPAIDAEHPTMKPVKLIAYLIRNSSKKGDVVLDTFGGSGTTLIAAEQMGRRCFMMELDPHYCDVIIARWEKLTGRTARKLTQ